MSELDIVIPTCNRRAALLVTLTSLLYQTFSDYRVIVSDQSEQGDLPGCGELRAVERIMRLKNQELQILRNMPRRGIAQQRQFLFDASSAPFLLYLDDDLVLEPFVIAQLLETLKAEGCGFVGSAVIGLSFRDDERPGEQAIELWEGPVRPERVAPGSPAWERHKLHNAANLLHVQSLYPARAPWTRYKIAWIGGCVLYNRRSLGSAGAYGFWKELPAEHCGEDVLAQLRVMEKFGGCGVLPSGVYHQELETTVSDRCINATELLRRQDMRIEDAPF